jgi:hypothetical protein
VVVSGEYSDAQVLYRDLKGGKVGSATHVCNHVPLSATTCLAACTTCPESSSLHLFGWSLPPLATLPMRGFDELAVVSLHSSHAYCQRRASNNIHHCSTSRETSICQCVLGLRVEQHAQTFLIICYCCMQDSCRGNG